MIINIIYDITIIEYNKRLVKNNPLKSSKEVKKNK